MQCDLGFVALVEASRLREIVVLAAGKVEFSHGDPLRMTPKAAERIIAAFKAQGVDLPIDYEHSTVFKAENAEKAPAAGWITAMHWEPDRGLIASVEWTTEARGYIETTEYKYLSPVVIYDVKTREPLRIHSMALTNKPATKHQRELLAASARLLEETLPMATKTAEASDTKDVKKKGVIVAQDDEAAAGPATDELAMAVGELAGALKAAGVSIEEGASVVAIVKAATAKIGGEGGGEPEPTAKEVAASENVLKLLGAKNGDEAILKLKADFVPRADHKLLSDRLADLEKRDAAREVETVIAKMVNENKINLNDEEQLKACRAYAEKDLAGFTAFMDAQPPYMEPGRKVAPMPDKGGSREAIIAASFREYDAQERTAQALCSRRAWMNDELRRKGLAVMTADEMSKIGVN